jgi:hypothetical protein
MCVNKLEIVSLLSRQGISLVLDRMMKKILPVAVSVLAIGGLVREALEARAADPFSLSAQSTILTFLFSIFLFAVNLKSFKRLEHNLGKFDFDHFALGGQMYVVRDRSRDILKALDIGFLDPPK